MYVCMHIDGRVMLSAGEVKGDVLANTTSIGMHPHTDASPASASAVGSFELVFDAVYTPMDTTLLKVYASPPLLHSELVSLCSMLSLSVQ